MTPSFIFPIIDYYLATILSTIQPKCVTADKSRIYASFDLDLCDLDLDLCDLDLDHILSLTY